MPDGIRQVDNLFKVGYDNCSKDESKCAVGRYQSVNKFVQRCLLPQFASTILPHG